MWIVFARDVNGLPNSLEHFFLRFADLSRLEEPESRIVTGIIQEFVKANAPKSKLKQRRHTSEPSSDTSDSDSDSDDALEIRSAGDVDDAYLSCIPSFYVVTTL
jgi:hypothetical protein